MVPGRHGGHSTPYVYPTQEGMVGIVHPSIYTPREARWCIPSYIPWYHGGYGTPTCILHGTPSRVHHCTPSAPSTGSRVHPVVQGELRRGPGLWVENNIGYEAQRGSQAPKGVKSRRHLCAELLRFSGNKDRKDWIDEGSMPVYSLCSGMLRKVVLFLCAIRSLGNGRE